MEIEMENIQEIQIPITFENPTQKTCAFTGHRILEKDITEKKIKNEIENLIKKGVEIFYNGVAVGFDLFSAKILLKLKKKYPFVKLVACVPCYHQEKNYPRLEKEIYAEIIKKADEVITLSPYYFKGCMQARDKYMADRADVLLAYCKKETGGTAYTVKYFKKKYPLKEIIFL